MTATQDLARMSDLKLVRVKNVTHYTNNNFKHIRSLFFNRKLSWGNRVYKNFLSKSDGHDFTFQCCYLPAMKS